MSMYNLTCIYDKNSGQSNYVGCGQREMRGPVTCSDLNPPFSHKKIAEEIEWREGVRETNNKQQ